jgi:hypothetical protein
MRYVSLNKNVLLAVVALFSFGATDAMRISDDESIINNKTALASYLKGDVSENSEKFVPCLEIVGDKMDTSTYEKLKKRNAYVVALCQKEYNRDLEDKSPIYVDGILRLLPDEKEKDTVGEVLNIKDIENETFKVIEFCPDFALGKMPCDKSIFVDFARILEVGGKLIHCSDDEQDKSFYALCKNSGLEKSPDSPQCLLGFCVHTYVKGGGFQNNAPSYPSLDEISPQKKPFANNLELSNVVNESNKKQENTPNILENKQKEKELDSNEALRLKELEKAKEFKNSFEGRALGMRDQKHQRNYYAIHFPHLNEDDIEQFIDKNSFLNSLGNLFK